MQKQLCQSNIAPSIWRFQLWSIRHVPKHSMNTNLTLLGICADGGAAGVRLVSKSPHEHARFQPAAMLALFNGIPRKLTYCKKLFFATSWISREYVRLGNITSLFWGSMPRRTHFVGVPLVRVYESCHGSSQHLPRLKLTSTGLIDRKIYTDWQKIIVALCCTIENRTFQCSRLNAGPTKTLLLYDQQSNLLSYAKQWWIVNCDLKPYSACPWSWWVCS